MKNNVKIVFDIEVECEQDRFPSLIADLSKQILNNLVLNKHVNSIQSFAKNSPSMELGIIESEDEDEEDECTCDCNCDDEDESEFDLEEVPTSELLNEIKNRLV